MSNLHTNRSYHNDLNSLDPNQNPAPLIITTSSKRNSTTQHPQSHDQSFRDRPPQPSEYYNRVNAQDYRHYDELSSESSRYPTHNSLSHHQFTSSRNTDHYQDDSEGDYDDESDYDGDDDDVSDLDDSDNYLCHPRYSSQQRTHMHQQPPRPLAPPLRTNLPRYTTPCKSHRTSNAWNDDDSDDDKRYNSRYPINGNQPHFPPSKTHHTAARSSREHPPISTLLNEKSNTKSHQFQQLQRRQPQRENSTPQPIDLPQQLDMDQFQDIQRIMIEFDPQALLQLTATPSHELILTALVQKFPQIALKSTPTDAPDSKIIPSTTSTSTTSTSTTSTKSIVSVPTQISTETIPITENEKVKYTLTDIIPKYLPHIALMIQQVDSFYQYQGQMFQYQQHQYDQYTQQRKLNENEQIKKFKEMQFLKKQKQSSQQLQQQQQQPSFQLQNSTDIDELKAIIEAQQSIMGKSGVKIADCALSTSHFVSGGVLTQPLDDNNNLHQSPSSINLTDENIASSISSGAIPIQIPPFLMLKKKTGTGLPTGLHPTTTTTTLVPTISLQDQQHLHQTPSNITPTMTTSTTATTATTSTTSTTRPQLLELQSNPTHQLILEEYKQRSHRYVPPSLHQLSAETNTIYSSLYPNYSSLVDQGHPDTINLKFAQEPMAVLNNVYLISPEERQSFIDSQTASYVQPLFDESDLNITKPSQHHGFNNHQQSNLSSSSIPLSFDGPVNIVINNLPYWVDEHFILCFCGQFGDIHGIKIIYPTLPNVAKFHKTENIYAPLISNPVATSADPYFDQIHQDYINALPFWNNTPKPLQSTTNTEMDVVHRLNQRINFQPPLHGFSETHPLTAFIAFGNNADAAIALEALHRFKFKHKFGTSPSILHCNWASPYGAPSKLLCKSHVSEATSQGLLLDALRMKILDPKLLIQNSLSPANCCDFMKNFNKQQQPATHQLSRFTEQNNGVTGGILPGGIVEPMNSYLYDKKTPQSKVNSTDYSYLYNQQGLPIRETLKGVHVSLQKITEQTTKSKHSSMLMCPDTIFNRRDFTNFRQTLAYIPIIPAGSYYIQVQWPKDLLSMRLIDTITKTISTKLHYNFELELAKHFYAQYLTEQNLSQEQHIQLSQQKQLSLKQYDQTLLLHFNHASSNVFRKYGFIFDIQHPNRIYYQWRLYSYLQGDDIDTYSLLPFQMYHIGPYYIPPTPSAQPIS